MSKNVHLRNWIWRWHIMAGLITLPFLFLLAVTGSVYLFKQAYEDRVYQSVKQVQPVGAKISYQQQWENALAASVKNPQLMRIPNSDTEATEFKAGRFSGSRYMYVNPYTGEITGEIVQKDTFMQQVRKLHGELLLGKYGTKVIELVASWMVVLIITGLYIWWPRTGFKISSLYRIRFNQGKRLMFRDFHAVTGLWSSLFLVVILAGGFPWTDVFGSNFKTVRDATGTGYPSTWSSNKGLQSNAIGKAMTLDQMVQVAHDSGLLGDVSITLPYKSDAVFTVSNRAKNLSQQWVIHYDQYSGEQVKAHPWSDVGVLSQGRQVVMRLHQGEFFGFANWLLVLAVAVFLALMILASGSAYLMRKPKGESGFPPVPDDFRVGIPLLMIIIALGIVFPLFGFSLIAIVVGYGLHGLLIGRNSIKPLSN